MTGWPAVGDLVRLPAYVSGRPFRVLSVAAARVPGCVRLGGYLIMPNLVQEIGEHDVPVRLVHRLSDPAWDR